MPFPYPCSITTGGSSRWTSSFVDSSEDDARTSTVCIVDVDVDVEDVEDAEDQVGVGIATSRTENVTDVPPSE